MPSLKDDVMAGIDRGQVGDGLVGGCHDGLVGGSVDRRTLLLGAAGALVAAGWLPASSLGETVSVAGVRRPAFDAVLAHLLQRVLRDARNSPGTHFPGAILHVESTTLGKWTGVVGRARLVPALAMRPDDRFRAGSVVKMLVSVVVLQLVESGRLSLDDRLPKVLPASVVHRFRDAPEISIRMLLSHRSGIPDWLTPAVQDEIARDPAKVWKVSEFLALAASQPVLFAPGTKYSYSNTNYTLLGLIIEQVTSDSWRREVLRRIVSPLELKGTSLPAPGHRWLPTGHADGYGELDGRTVDLTGVDPSMAGAAGGGALVTTVQDLAYFLDALLALRLFRHRASLQQMLAFTPAPDVGGQVGYGLGIEQRLLPGGVEVIGHLGTTAGYCAYVGRLQRRRVTVASALNWDEDPSPVLVPLVRDQNLQGDERQADGEVETDRDEGRAPTQAL
jgi:D-alanyl-D-alanine carboxypeptidase